MSKPQQPPTTAATPPPSAATGGNLNAGAEAQAGAEGSRPRPRIAIQYCTQCKWMLRAAYFAQELLSTFSTDLQQVALVPCTGGIFTVTIYHTPLSTGHQQQQQQQQQQESEIATRLWDRKTNGGFPEVKVLKSLVRNVIDPSRSLGHTDRALKAQSQRQDPSSGPAEASNVQTQAEAQVTGDGDNDNGSQSQQTAGTECEECR